MAQTDLCTGFVERNRTSILCSKGTRPTIRRPRSLFSIQKKDPPLGGLQRVFETSETGTQEGVVELYHPLAEQDFQLRHSTDLLAAPKAFHRDLLVAAGLDCQVLPRRFYFITLAERRVVGVICRPLERNLVAKLSQKQHLSALRSKNESPKLFSSGRERGFDVK